MRRVVAIVITAAAFLAPALVVAQSQTPVSGVVRTNDAVLRLIQTAQSRSLPYAFSISEPDGEIVRLLEKWGYRPQKLQDDVATWLQNNRTEKTIHLAVPEERKTSGWTVERNAHVLCMRSPSGGNTKYENIGFLIASTAPYLVWTSNANQECN